MFLKFRNKNNKNTSSASLNYCKRTDLYLLDNKIILHFWKKSVYLHWIYGKNGKASQESLFSYCKSR
ncbi:MAG TPA: hypothetical protein DCQ68_15220 [Chryseobacterium indologenes]|nr:hypothetical protein [Chryseobacterium indologenes]